MTAIIIQFSNRWRAPANTNRVRVGLSGTTEIGALNTNDARNAMAGRLSNRSVGRARRQVQILQSASQASRSYGGSQVAALTTRKHKCGKHRSGLSSLQQREGQFIAYRILQTDRQEVSYGRTGSNSTRVGRTANLEARASCLRKDRTSRSLIFNSARNPDLFGVRMSPPRSAARLRGNPLQRQSVQAA